MGRDLEIQILEKKIEKAKTHEEKVPHLAALKALDPGSKLLAAHKKGGQFYTGPADDDPVAKKVSRKAG